MKTDFRHGRPTIGVLAGWQFYRTATNLSYLAPLYRGIASAAKDVQCNVLLGCGMGPSASPTDPMKAAWPVLLSDQDFIPIGAWNTDGLIVAVPLHSKAHADYIQNLRRQNHPVLFIGSGQPGPTIAVDNAGGISKAMQHLYEHGHRQIAFIAGSENDMEGDTGIRLDAYKTFLESHNLKKDPGLVAFSRHIYSGGYQAIEKILASGGHFSAVMASNDESALGAIEALTKAGFRVPEDIAVIGFDNRFEGAIHEPSLSTIHLPLFDIGYCACQLIHENILEGYPLPEKIEVEAQLVIRRSCGCGNVPPLLELTDPLIEASSPETVLSPDLSERIAEEIMKEVQNFSRSEMVSLCTQFVNAYQKSLSAKDGLPMQKALTNILKNTENNGDGVYVWQRAITILDLHSRISSIEPSDNAKTILEQARQQINAFMQKQYQRHVVRERWITSRLSLLTAELLTALNEEQIYSILSKRLAELSIPTARLALFKPESKKTLAISTIRDLTHPSQEPVVFATRNFPPEGYFENEKPFSLTLIPVSDLESQRGFMVFDTDHLELYGSIVQQVGSSLNTLRLYQQATEGRKLAEEANRLKSRFLSMISHELRTPLNLISGLSEIVLQEAEEEQTRIPFTIQKDISNISTYAQHLNGLLGDVIDLATFDVGKLRLNKELIDLGETLQIVVESGRQLAFEKGLQWHASIPESGPWVWGDRTRLRQVVLNLINNAVKFTYDGQIKLLLVEEKDKVIITVSDMGIGIPPDEQGEIFDAFRRSKRSVSLGLPGLGLGLTISKMIIDLHDGKIGLRSTGIEGQGSTFFVELPTMKLPSFGSDALDETRLGSESAILLLTNRPGSNLDLIETLSKRNIKVHEAVMGEHEIWQAKLNSISPDVIVLDVKIQSDLTWRTLNAIKENVLTQEIPILLYASNEGHESLLRLDYLTKPFRVEELISALDNHWDAVGHQDDTRTILIVDDEPDTLDLYARIVKSQSAVNTIRLANNGLQALEILQKEAVDLVLLDLQMPKLDGFGVLQAMREDERTRNIPVIVVTGLVLTEEEMNRLNEGVAVILQKGLFSMDETADHIEATLNQKRQLSNETKNLIRQAIVFIQENYQKPISRKEIAQHIAISKDYLTYCFRQELNTTPIRYLQRYRINLAKSLLKNSSKSVTEVALDVGFSDSGYFSRIFHRETGMSPDQYRHS